ncbi:MAG: hypothetical protein DJ555_08135 [Desulfurococcaceae archaeon]|jgi:hypothetical protein|nr:MAG: hypothetical protein DJ555_08135 [Desulfurococcaceae archaeon]
MGRILPCPFYRGGACHSPKLEEPDDSVVAASRCRGPPETYMGCSLYVNTDLGVNKPPENNNNSGKGGVRVITKNSIASKIYSPIHLLKEPLISECPGYRIENVGTGYVAFCNVLRRALTKYEAKLCSLYWRECPYILTRPQSA